MRVILAAILSAILVGGGAVAQKAGRGAASDEHVTVILNHVKADKRQQFEQFVDALHQASQRAASSDRTAKLVHEQTRVIVPTKPNADGTYTYIFILDPEVEGGNYRYKDVLTKGLGAAEAEKYVALNDEALARPQESYEGRQSKVW